MDTHDDPFVRSLLRKRRMEQPLISLRKKADLYKTFFFQAVQEDNETPGHEEHVSLKSAFSRFVQSRFVIAYYTFVPLIAELMELVKPLCVNDTELAKHFDVLIRETSAFKANNSKAAFTHVVKEVNYHLDEIERQIDAFIDHELEKRKILCDRDLLHLIIHHYWKGKREAYLNKNTGLERLTCSYTMQQLLGFNVTEKKNSATGGGTTDAFEQRWHSAVWDYLVDRDHYHLHIIAKLDGTMQELDGLYLNMQNIVSFKAMVMLTMWRYSLNKGEKSIVEILHPASGGEEEGGDDHDWTLAYGSFRRDYDAFIAWHHFGFEGYSVHLNLYYIDFDASPSSQAISLDLSSSRHHHHHHHHHSVTSFAALFTHHQKPLGLSYMMPKSDALERTKMIKLSADKEKREVDALISQELTREG